ncbi:MAG: hypothetical protein QXN15_11985 [Candidatus Jordarchaeales archaeon]|nr:hypothetical protein [Candidatus Jordarchaeia archaeon]
MIKSTWRSWTHRLKRICLDQSLRGETFTQVNIEVLILTELDPTLIINELWKKRHWRPILDTRGKIGRIDTYRKRGS